MVWTGKNNQSSLIRWLVPFLWLFFLLKKIKLKRWYKGICQCICQIKERESALSACLHSLPPDSAPKRNAATRKYNPHRRPPSPAPTLQSSSSLPLPASPGHEAKRLRRNHRQRQHRASFRFLLLLKWKTSAQSWCLPLGFGSLLSFITDPTCSLCCSICFFVAPQRLPSCRSGFWRFRKLRSLIVAISWVSSFNGGGARTRGRSRRRGMLSLQIFNFIFFSDFCVSLTNILFLTKKKKINFTKHKFNAFVEKISKFLAKSKEQNIKISIRGGNERT